MQQQTQRSAPGVEAHTILMQQLALHELHCLPLCRLYQQAMSLDGAYGQAVCRHIRKLARGRFLRHTTGFIIYTKRKLALMSKISGNRLAAQNQQMASQLFGKLHIQSLTCHLAIPLNCHQDQ
jgi:hypothetical protein